MLQRVEKEVGNLVLDNGRLYYYEGGRTFNGECYKDREAFNSGEGVCYISEYGLVDLDEDIKELAVRYENGEITRKQFLSDKQDILQHCGWTRQDIVNLCGGEGFEKMAEIVFDMIDWQSPETYLNEMEIDDIKDLLNIPDEKLREAGYID